MNLRSWPLGAKIAAGAAAFAVLAGSVFALSRSDGDEPERLATGQTTAPVPTTSEAPTTTASTTIPVADIYSAMEAEILRACDVAVYAAEAPDVTFKPEWSAVSTEEKLLAAAQRCVDLRSAQQTASTTTTEPQTQIETTTIDGWVSFLLQVSFAGTIDGTTPYPRPANGSPCSGTDGYGDLTPGGRVTIAGADGKVLTTVPLGGGTTEQTVKGTESERLERIDLIDAIYDLRIAQAYGDTVRQAELDLERAELHLYELDHPQAMPPPFEGHRFEAVWCNLPFSAARLPRSTSYTITVTTRGSQTYTAQELDAARGQLDLVIG